jgi:hypothetical protein
MDESEDALSREAPRTLDLELDLVGGAISMVASGAAPRVTVASLRFGDQLLGPARRMAAAAGVRVVPEWSADESCATISIERVSGD